MHQDDLNNRFDAFFLLIKGTLYKFIVFYYCWNRV